MPTTDMTRLCLALLAAAACGGVADPTDDEGGFHLAGRWRFEGVDLQEVRFAGDGPTFTLASGRDGAIGTAEVSGDEVAITGRYVMHGTIAGDGRAIAGTWAADDGSDQGSFTLRRLDYDLRGRWRFEGVGRADAPRRFVADFEGAGDRYQLAGADGLTGAIVVDGPSLVITGVDAARPYTMLGVLDPTATRIDGIWAYDDSSDSGEYRFTR
jgi:hypothetical protein